MLAQGAILVDAGYLFAQGAVTLTGGNRPRGDLVLEPRMVCSTLGDLFQSLAPNIRLLRIYWYDGAPKLRGPSRDQEDIASQPNVKLRLGTINSFGQQKGVDSLIVMDLVDLARNGAISDALICSGDEDIRIGVELAQAYGVRVHLLGLAPARGSQSMELLQEADTTTEWSSETVKTFLSVREAGQPAPAAAATSKQVEINLLPKAPLPAIEPHQESETDPTSLFERIARETLETATRETLLSAVSTIRDRKGIIPEIDRPALGKLRDLFGRELDADERRAFRKFLSTTLLHWAAQLADGEE